MTTIGLIRHGITAWNELGMAQGRTDIPLNELGKQQAMKIAERLSFEDWDMIGSSHLLRAVETATIIGEKRNMPITFLDERIQELNCGEIEGTTEEERAQKWGSNWREQDLGMETVEEVFNRGMQCIDEIVQLHKGKKVLLVSHGAMIGILLQRLLPDVFRSTYMDNTSLTILTNTDGIWDCRLYNCKKHL
ncbi:histidine phosphatase family protein [Robertmurraya kyonggiensis]|uniref:Histidine phosphatase family protein n=1 Tax=Robertmurraya kyonggiensis TaxID=1037680 RepID=A0A4U1D8R1_9BACI|nr:histidine phosphatase family protein [Robertmurraya kyonggiensis]TKC18824.1 histidine phosphatase family protein [Robertmurraya kyonggiensis]